MSAEPYKSDTESDDIDMGCEGCRCCERHDTTIAEVRRLRDSLDEIRTEMYWDDTMDQIGKLKADNKRLREALGSVLRLAITNGSSQIYMEARAALNPTGPAKDPA